MTAGKKAAYTKEFPFKKDKKMFEQRVFTRREDSSGQQWKVIETFNAVLYKCNK